MIEIVINDKYKSITDFINSIPSIFDTQGECIYEGRNVLKIFNVDGKRVCVKSFKKPNIINKVAYKYFRKSKAKRSYEYALKLTNLDLNTPEPIACIQESGAFLGRSFYISLFEDYDFTLRELFTEDITDKENIFRQFIDFTYSLHRNNILHLDYSPGNVLITKKSDSYSFSVVDVNRMKFMDIDLDICLINLSKIWAADYMYPIIAEKYSEFFNCPYDEVYDKYFALETKHKSKVLRKKRIKKYIRSLRKS